MPLNLERIRGLRPLDTRLGLENIKIRADTMYYVMPRLLKFHVKNGAAIFKI